MTIKFANNSGSARRVAVATAVAGIAFLGTSTLAFAEPGKKSEAPKPTVSATHTEPARPEPTKTEKPKPEPTKTEKPEPTKTESPKPTPTSTTGYPPVPASCSTNTGTVGFRGQVRFSCSGFAAHELVSITLTRKGVTRSYTWVTTEASGKFTVFVRVGEAGPVTITATGNTSHKSASSTVLVVGGPGKKLVAHPRSAVAAKAIVASAPNTRLVSASATATAPDYNVATATWAAVGAIGLGGGLLMLGAAKRRKEASA